MNSVDSIDIQEVIMMEALEEEFSGEKEGSVKNFTKNLSEFYYGNSNEEMDESNLKGDENLIKELETSKTEIELESNPERLNSGEKSGGLDPARENSVPPEVLKAGNTEKIEENGVSD